MNHLAGRVSLTTEEREALMVARIVRRFPVKLLAYRLGVSPRTLMYWQSGEHRPTSDQLRAWWRALA